MGEGDVTMHVEDDGTAKLQMDLCGHRSSARAAVSAFSGMCIQGGSRGGSFISIALFFFLRSPLSPGPRAISPLLTSNTLLKK